LEWQVSGRADDQDNAFCCPNSLTPTPRKVREGWGTLCLGRASEIEACATGNEEIRADWTRQPQEFDPHVEPIEVIDREGGKTDVRVRQFVQSLGGDVRSDSSVA